MDRQKLRQSSPSPNVTPATAQDLERARALARIGRAPEAEKVYRQILSREPGCGPAAVALAPL